jgi:serine/threonine protein kinase
MSIRFDHPDYVALRDRIREDPKDFVAIIGSGLSIPCGLPSWEGLKEAIVEDARKRSSEILNETEKKGNIAIIEKISGNTNLWQCFSELKRLISNQAYEKTIKDNLTVKDKTLIPRSYDLLWKLDIRGVITFNIDTCALDSFSRVKQYAADSATAKEVSRFGHFLSSPNKFVFQPHGTVLDPTSWVFTSSDLAELLNNNPYLDFMKTLMQSKNLLIIGFNPSDFAFTYLFQHALTSSGGTGLQHYIFLPNPDHSQIRELGDKGVAVISYSPADPLQHNEIEEALQDILSFLPADDIAPAVSVGAALAVDSLPSQTEMLSMPDDEMRKLLNAAVLSILPSDNPREEDLVKLDKFYKDNLKAIHQAWLIEPDSACDILYGHKILSPIGRGAFGQVYRSEKLDNGELIAVKILLPEVRSDREYLNSFRRGVRSMRILTNRKVDGMVKFIEAYEIPACVFMEFIDGPNLTKAMEWGHFDRLSKCLDILVKVGKIVHDAHNLEELVLHRDLKPDNVILRGGYDANDDADVVVCDFDLSWHKGASDLSVVHGARAEGYAAPEQTATGHQSGVSTRNTAVDVFGIGMIAFYLMVEDNPRPNEHKFPDFDKKIVGCVKKKNDSDWHSLPHYLKDVIVGCTKDVQSERIPFSSAVESFEICHTMALTNTLKSNHPLILLEIASVIDTSVQFKVTEFGRCVTVISADGSKQIEVRLKNDASSIVIGLKLSKIRADHEHRHVLKYLPTCRDKVISKLKTGQLKNIKGDIGTSRLDVVADWYPQLTVSSADVKKLGELVIEARCLLELS